MGPIPYSHQPAQMSDDQPVQSNSISVRWGSAPYSSTTVQVLYCTIFNRRKGNFITHILARIFIAPFFLARSLKLGARGLWFH
jgi:hypothetical protein